jgi:hypothetical protein
MLIFGSDMPSKEHEHERKKPELSRKKTSMFQNRLPSVSEAVDGRLSTPNSPNSNNGLNSEDMGGKSPGKKHGTLAHAFTTPADYSGSIEAGDDAEDSPKQRKKTAHAEKLKKDTSESSELTKEGSESPSPPRRGHTTSEDGTPRSPPTISAGRPTAKTRSSAGGSDERDLLKKMSNPRLSWIPTGSRQTVRGGEPATDTKCSIKISRMRRLLEARQEEFKELPMPEQERLKNAFAAADKHHTAELNGQGVLIALAELGLDGRNADERAAISQVMQEDVLVCGKVNFFDFVFQMVPKFERKIQELRSPKIFQEFNRLDVHGMKRLEYGVCLQALERHSRKTRQRSVETVNAFWKNYESQFDRTFASVKNNRDAVDFGAYQALVADLEKSRLEFFAKAEHRAAILCKISPSLVKAHMGELAYLRSVFIAEATPSGEEHYHASSSASPSPRRLAVVESQDVPNIALSNIHQVLAALFDAGVMPTVGDMVDTANDIIEDYEERREMQDSQIRFAEFLGLVQRLREDGRRHLRAAMQALKPQKTTGCLKGAKQDSGKQIEKIYQTQDLPFLIDDLQLLSDVVYRFEELKQTIQLCEQDQQDHQHHEEDGESDEVKAANIVNLLLEVLEIMRASSRAREKATGTSLGFNAMQMLNLRVSFTGLTKTGLLDATGLRSILRQINPNANLMDKDIEQIMQEVAANKDEEVGDSCLQMSSQMERQESNGGSRHPSKDRAMGYDKVSGDRCLRFDSFLWLSAILLEVR